MLKPDRTLAYRLAAKRNIMWDMLIDSHCHLTYPGLSEDVAAVLHRAAAVGVTRVISIGTDLPDHEKTIAMADAHPTVFAALGVHPHHAAEVEEGYAAILENRLKSHGKILAVGECGLDYHYNFSPRVVQRDMFITHLEIARRVGLPVILHVREAHADALAIMKDFAGEGLGGGLRYVVHCFTGTPVECEAWLSLGAYISIPGIVTYKKAADVQASAKLIPSDRLLLETDAPYLSPEPVRKHKTNEPANVAHIARFLAGLRDTSLDQLAEQTTANAAKLFGEQLVRP